MVNENETRTNKPLVAENSGEKLPFLPQEFFVELLGLPSCKLTGKCDNCGKCG